MRCKTMLMLLLVLLVLTGCAINLSAAQVAEEITACYQRLSPTAGTTNLLATLPYQGSLLVLAEDRSAAGAPLLDLFLLNQNGVQALASAPLSKKIKLHSLVAGNDTLIYGPLPTAAEKEIASENIETSASEETENNLLPSGESQAFATITGKAAITLKSWKIIEQELPITRGFILILKKQNQAEAINLYDEKGQILAQFDKLNNGAMKETNFIAWEELPLPCELQQENIVEIQVAASLNSAAEKWVTLEEEDVREPLVTAFNACFAELKRKGSETTEEVKLVAAIHFTDGSSALIKQHSDNFTVSFETADFALHYEVSSKELTELFTTYRKLL